MSRLVFNCRFDYPGGFRLDAAFEAGEGTTALFGVSGAGKTTVFNLIAGLLHPRDGYIGFGTREFVDTRTGRHVRPENRRVGVVFQDHRLFPHLNVRDNLNFGTRHRPSSAGSAFRFDRVVELLEIGPLLGRAPATLSGGERQRVAIGRALRQGPELLLMDEPVSALQAGLKQRILGYIQRVLNEWHVPTLLVSHDQADVGMLAGRVVVIDDGRVIDSGPTATTLPRAVLTHMKHSPGLVNLLRVADVRTVDQHCQGRIGEQAVVLPAAVGAEAGASVCVQFLPRDVTLARDAVAGLSARNQLRGVVREIITLADRTFVAVDIGQFVWAEVTAESVAELAIAPQAPIVCVIKAAAMSWAG